MPLSDWVVVAGLLTNLLLAAFTYGKMSEAVMELKRRLDVVERRLDRHVTRTAED